eukprot:1119634-Amphidinium_carterae.1
MGTALLRAVNFEDLKGCFYFFGLREGWAQLFAFDLKYTPAEFGRFGPYWRTSAATLRSSHGGDGMEKSTLSQIVNIALTCH